MGRRAKKAPVVTKRRPKLSKRFKCPFCANDDVVECKMDFKAGTGSLSCRLCGAAYQMPIHHLHEPIDVFSEWLDDCEAAQNPQNNESGVPRYDDEDDEDDDELPQHSGLASAGRKQDAAAANRSIDLELDSDGDDDDE